MDLEQYGLGSGDPRLVRGPTQVEYCFYRPHCKSRLTPCNNDWTKRKYHTSCMAYAIGPTQARQIMKDMRRGIYHQIASLQTGEEDRDVPYHEILEITNQALTVANNEANRQIRTLRGQLEYQNELLADAGYYDEEEGLMDPVHFHTRRAEFLPDEEKEEVKQEEKQASNISDHTHDHMVVDTEGSEKLSKDLSNMKL